MRLTLLSTLPRRPRVPDIERLRDFASARVGLARTATRFDPVSRVLKRAASVMHLHGGARHWRIVATLVRAAAVPPVPARTITTTRVARVLERERLRTVERRNTRHILRIERRDTRHILRIERLTRRLDARPRPTPAPVAAVVRSEQPARFPRVALTVVRHAPPAASAAQALAPTSSRSRDAEEARASRPGSRVSPIDAAAGLPPQELARVTDHVIRQLDRRVLSWQERTGRL